MARKGHISICFNTDMNESVDVTTQQPSAGDTVQVLLPDGRVTSGTLIEDFADYTLTGDAVGRNWAMPHRWAVATDAGTLVFVDDADIIDHSSPRSTP